MLGVRWRVVIGRDASGRMVLFVLVACVASACGGKARRAPGSIGGAGAAGDAAGGASGGTGGATTTGGAGGTESEGGTGGTDAEGGTSSRYRITGSFDTFGAGTRDTRAYVLTHQTLLELPPACSAEYCVAGGILP